MKDIDFLGRTARVEFQIAAGGPDGSPFTTKTGAVYRHDHYGTTIFGKAVRAAGLPAETMSHDLRHHYASVLFDAGEGPVAVAERLGHENATLVLTTYGHLILHREDRARAAVDGAWGAWRATNVPPPGAAAP